MNKEKVIEAILEVGGVKELAALLGVSYKTVLDWKNGRTGIAVTNALRIEKATEGKVKAKDILPNYPWEELQ